MASNGVRSSHAISIMRSICSKLNNGDILLQQNRQYFVFVNRTNVEGTARQFQHSNFPVFGSKARIHEEKTMMFAHYVVGIERE
jgi:hypothetical protein